MEFDKEITMGVTEQFKLDSIEDAHVEEIRRNGYTLLENVLSTEEVKFLQGGVLENIYETQCEEFGGEEKLKSIGDEYSAKALLAYDEFFADLVKKRRIHDVVEKILGNEYKLCLQNAIMNFPKHFNPAGVWHRDTPYQHYVSTRPLAITTLVIVDEFNEETGGTRFLPGSQRYEEFPSNEFTKKHAQQLSADPGSVLVFDTMMYHRAGYNKSNQPRRAIVQLFTTPITEQTINFSKLLDGKFEDDPELNKLIGYKYGGGSADSVLDYRETRLKLRGGKSGPGDGRLREINLY